MRLYLSERLSWVCLLVGILMVSFSFFSLAVLYAIRPIMP